MPTLRRLTLALHLVLAALPVALPFVCVNAAFAQKPVAPSSYHLIKRFSVAGDEGWDYLTIDPTARRMYISRSTRVAVVDIDRGKVVGEIPSTAGVHGIALDTKAGRGFTSNGRSNTVTIFDLKTLARIADVPVGEGPDAILFDSATDRVFTFNGRGKTATAIDAAKGAVVGTVTLPGKPEFGVSDGAGHLYNNIEDKSTVVEIDAKTLKVTREFPIAPGEGPSGLAIDPKKHHTFSVCDDVMVVVDTQTGKVVGTPKIGGGPDAAAFDPATGLAFSSNGEDGTLSVVRETAGGAFETVATVKTASGARTMALDPTTHHVFVVTAKIAAAPAPAAGTTPAPGRPRRRYEPGSFEVLEYGP